MKKLLLLLLLCVPNNASAQENPITLYPQGVPNSKPTPADYVETIVNGTVKMVSVPTLTPYLPATGKANGSAVNYMPRWRIFIRIYDQRRFVDS